MRTISRRGLLGMLGAMFSQEPLLSTEGGPVSLHEHRWAWSPYLVTAFSTRNHPSTEVLTPLQVCSVKGCGVLRMLNGWEDAGKAALD